MIDMVYCNIAFIFPVPITAHLMEGRRKGGKENQIGISVDVLLSLPGTLFILCTNMRQKPSNTVQKGTAFSAKSRLPHLPSGDSVIFYPSLYFFFFFL